MVPAVLTLLDWSASDVVVVEPPFATGYDGIASSISYESMFATCNNETTIASGVWFESIFARR